MKVWGVYASLLLVSSLAIAQNLPVQDADFGCVTRAEAEKYVNDFRINISSFGGWELCSADKDTKKLLNDLLLIEKGSFSESESENSLIRGFIPQDKYYPWLKSQTRGVSRGNDVPYATAYNRMGYFTMQDGWAQLSTLGRVGVMIHEARHTAGYRHIPCTSGPYAGAGTAGCDRDYGYGGSHGVEMEYYSRVQLRGVNFHPVYKTMARLMAMGRANFVFNSPVLRAKEALLAMPEGGTDPQLFYQGKRVSREGPAVHGVLKRTSFGASIFEGFKALAIDLYQTSGFHPDLPDVYSYYKLLDRNNGALKDFEEYDSGGKRYAVRLDEQDRISTYNFPTGKWNPSRPLGLSVMKTVTTLPNGERGYFLIDSENRIFPFDADKNVLGPAKSESWPEHIETVAHDENGERVFLRSDRSVWSVSREGNWTPYLSGSWSSIVSVPVYDAYEVLP
ncbi:MAG: hypothetical protein KF789_02595 [Bdellovibrionaceae bacterium]|nr:hypothetical protein [Pseudobdellovibrionaceae bacterium]